VKPESVLRPGDLCVNSTGTGTIGRVGLWEDAGDGTFFADTHVTVVRPNPDRIVPKFLSESLLSPWLQREMEINCFAGSTNQIELNKSAFSELALLVPPLPEQRKIAAVLSSVDDAIEASQAVIDQLGVVKKAMMAQLLTRGLPGRHSRFKMTEIGEMPEEWEIAKLERLCLAVVDCPHTTPEYVDVGFPVIRTADVIPGRILFRQAKQVSEKTLGERVKRLLPLPGDIFYSREGERFGIAGPVPQGIRTCVGQRMMHLRAAPETDPSFLCWLMNAPVVYGQAVAEVGGSTSPHVNVGAVKRFLVPRPLKTEQIAIGALLDSVELRVESEKAVLDGCSAFKVALMSVLLTGEVRVKPDEGAAA
jgi:type I restriction enzyme S subunit